MSLPAAFRLQPTAASMALHRCGKQQQLLYQKEWEEEEEDEARSLAHVVAQPLLLLALAAAAGPFAPAVWVAACWAMKVVCWLPIWRDACGASLACRHLQLPCSPGFAAGVQLRPGSL